MIRTLRIYFLSRLLREKLLLVAFAAIAVLIWISAFSSRGGAFWRQKAATTAELKLQDEWLSNQTRIEQSVQRAAAQLEPAKTLDGIRLFAAVRALAQEAGLRNTANSGTLPPETNGQFTEHSLQFQVNNADWESIKRFYLLLNARAPYIAVRQFILTRMPSNPALLNLTLRVSSIEVTRTAIPH